MVKKDIVLENMKSNGNKMFHSCVRRTTGQLKGMQKGFDEMLMAGVSESYKELMAAASSTFMPAAKDRKLSEDEIRLRNAGTAILRTIPDRFKQA